MATQLRGSSPGTAPKDDSTSIDERVLPPGAQVTRDYLLLSAIAALAVVLFGIRWVTLPAIGQHPILYVSATLVAAYYVVVWAARWAALIRMRRPHQLSPQPGLRVAVATSFVPGVEPLAMLESTVQALVAMDYPHDTWVLDEGDDPDVRAVCRRLGARHFTRRNQAEFRTRSGQFAAHTKHGNYNAWLSGVVKDSYDVVVTFDPDHVPRRAYLMMLLGYFRDPGVGYVQAPAVYFNQEASFIARGAAEETYAYHSSHQMASYALGHPVIVGSHSLHRVAALRQVGGFPAHHAEDLYLTMLYRAEGWRGVYVPRILALGVTPVDWQGYLSQQSRWARAVVDLKLHAFRALAHRLSPLERVLNLFHGVYFLRPVAFFVLFAMLVVMLLQDTVPSFLDAGPLLGGVGLLVVLHLVDRFRQRFFFDAEREQGLHWRAGLLQLAKWPHLVSALFDAAINRRVDYAVTRKTAATESIRHILTPPHLGISVVLASAAAIGVSRHGALPPTLAVLAVLAIGSSLLLAITDWLSFPQPYDLALLKRRQEEVDVLLKSSLPERGRLIDGLRAGFGPARRTATNSL
ncbi:MAG: glycosyltransferase, partial [Anaerolineae bacterium]|nr:glycosyltransferase [Gemmatimonadaceae bacterium]